MLDQFNNVAQIDVDVNCHIVVDKSLGESPSNAV